MALDNPNDVGSSSNLVELTADIVAGYVANNSVPVSELPALMTAVHSALSGLGQAEQAPAEKPTPHMPIKKTITDDYLVSLEDGKHYKTLKRHLAGRGLTPAQYREKWGLPADYPMAAPGYSARRSELAKAIGLGSLRKRGAEAPAEAAEAPKGRGRKAATKAVAPDPVVKAPAKRRGATKA